MRDGYPTELAVTPLTKEQRQRLEAFTAARALLMDRGALAPLSALLTVARYIETGE
jgi:hypothetical protein